MDDFQESELIAETMPTIDVYTDGGFRNQLGYGGYGAIAVCGPYSQFYYGGYANVSNNEMEIMAVLAVLRSLICPCKVHIVSDSRYVVDALNKWILGWRNNGWVKRDGKPVANRQMWEEMFAYMQYHIIHAEWRRGHQASNIENTLCDHLATIGTYKAANLPVPGQLIAVNRA